MSGRRQAVRSMQGPGRGPAEEHDSSCLLAKFRVDSFSLLAYGLVHAPASDPTAVPLLDAARVGSAAAPRAHIKLPPPVVL
ncbi:hypothetical protein METUNv1_03678 [Methyloversatilis universalis FAM5]|uniref:Uncharacterized protein n=1 Tax=Methyloversatilis universalis (strain ATCC BAA-1314 / DSM 25237 / JCM 13912 / CCUG 52030 / FAM5) TaxID=1000565 RepID=F5RH85_METUF|nr:hypothetical protein METUNv1_03678 [Methyloversatilis universalis FAM5]